MVHFGYTLLYFGTNLSYLAPDLSYFHRVYPTLSPICPTLLWSFDIPYFSWKGQYDSWPQRKYPPISRNGWSQQGKQHKKTRWGRPVCRNPLVLSPPLSNSSLHIYWFKNHYVYFQIYYSRETIYQGFSFLARHFPLGRSKDFLGRLKITKIQTNI